MQNFLAKCGAIALLVGGFVCTGDLGRLSAKGARLLSATTAPELEKAGETAPSPTSPSVASPSLSPTSAGPAPGGGPLSAHPADAPVGWPADVPPPPANALSTVTLASLAPGDRVFVWLSRATHGGKHVTPHLLVAFDIVDATAAEVLEHRHCVAPTGAFTSGGPQATSQAPPRRVRIVENRPKSLLSALFLGRAAKTSIVPLAAENSRQITCGEPLSVAALAGSHASSAPAMVDHLGVVTALAVVKANPE